jgi:glycosyltransferase involved in cell wall biosynthesis
VPTSSQRPLLSIIMPVYNEQATFEATFAEVYAKRIPGIDTQLIVVESNSTDGTRASVLRCAGLPRVQVILQDRPRGKGNAVREGLSHASGDFVLIQDADREYDVDDYDALIEPLRQRECAFVLGSRHTGDWRIRSFNTQPGLATFFNVGHAIFLRLFNLLYGQHLTDPFTMFKVFRRDCLDNIVLECDRFDFDYELVIKLIRQGYEPLEIPVNYHARSFSEGKKIDALRDPITWIRALLKYRLRSVASWTLDGRGRSSRKPAVVLHLPLPAAPPDHALVA